MFSATHSSITQPLCSTTCQKICHSWPVNLNQVNFRIETVLRVKNVQLGEGEDVHVKPPPSKVKMPNTAHWFCSVHAIELSNLLSLGFGSKKQCHLIIIKSITILLCSWGSNRVCSTSNRRTKSKSLSTNL